MKENMKLNLITKLKDFTKRLQLNEEDYMRRYKEIVKDDIISHKDLTLDSKTELNDNNNNNNNNNQKFLETEREDNILVKRDQEINTLVTSINELAGIYKEMQSLVLVQGTILDRIDYNIDNALQNVKQANKELTKADENMKSGCARNSIMFLIVAIFILGVLLIFKFFH